ncbi:hypothetical protein [Acrocarpospora catenulata]|uniref:hypothetical protein n=1 Tax=Acrocarpospora catenulata TaxID=2836182 RepID=UPI001BDB2863|nr:hypothetical protein [Acrocarpospora catenulata]
MSYSGTSASPNDQLHARTALILASAAVIAFCAAVPTWFLFDGLLNDKGGPVVPSLAAFAAAATQFTKFVDLLRRTAR